MNKTSATFASATFDGSFFLGICWTLLLEASATFLGCKTYLYYLTMGCKRERERVGKYHLYSFQNLSYLVTKTNLCYL